MGEGPNRSGNTAAGSCTRSRTASAGWRPTTSTCTRSTARRRHRYPGDPRGAGRPRRPGKIRYLGTSTFPAVPDGGRRSGRPEKRHSGRFVSEQPPYPMLVRGIETEVLPVTQQYGMGTLIVEPARRRLAVGQVAQGPDAPETTAPRRWAAGRRRYDLSDPINQRKLDAADALAGVAEHAGMSLVELVIAFASGTRASLVDHRPAHDGAAGPASCPRWTPPCPTSAGCHRWIVPPGTNIRADDAGYRRRPSPTPPCAAADASAGADPLVPTGRTP